MHALDNAAFAQVSATEPAKVPKESARSWNVAGVPAVIVWLATPAGTKQ